MHCTKSHGHQPARRSLLPALLHPLHADVYPADRLFAPCPAGGRGGQTHHPRPDPARGSPHFSSTRGEMLVCPAHPSDGNSWDGFFWRSIKHYWSRVPPGGFHQPAARVLVIHGG